MKALPAVSGLVALGLALGCAQTTEVATVLVERRDLVHRVSAEGTLEAKTATTISVPGIVRQGARISWMAADGGGVREGEVVVRFDATEMERALEESSADYESGSRKIEKTTVESSTKMSRIATNREVAELELDVAERYRKTDEDLYSRNEIIESAIDGDLAVDRRENANAMLGIQRDLTDAEIELLQIERRKAQISIDQARDGMTALEIRAPNDGLLAWSRDWRGELPQVGQQVWPGQSLGEIPELREMKAQIYLLEADAGGLDAGLRATIRVDAHPEREIEARVVRFDPVAKPRFRGSPVQYFGVELELDESDPEIMKPGQRVSAVLYLESFENEIVIPRQALMSDDQGPFVYVQTGGTFERRSIGIKAQSTALIVIDDGLEAGERVAMEPPAAVSEAASGVANRSAASPAG